MSLLYFLLYNWKQLVFKEVWLFWFCLNKLSKDFYIVKHFSSQSLQLKKKVVILYCFSIFCFSSRTLSIMKVFYSGGPCSLPSTLQVCLSQTTFPAMGKFPFQPGLVRTHGSQWTPEPSTRDHKETWSGTCSHSGEHWPATPKLQCSPNHLEMYMDFTWDRLGS